MEKDYTDRACMVMSERIVEGACWEVREVARRQPSEA